MRRFQKWVNSLLRFLPLGIAVGATSYSGVNFNTYSPSGVTVDGIGATDGVCGH